eukprot:TRINITY_DN5709_c0_g4_i1.p1 TRINITY_DN5709_c0_g4~~TRINITY_DN5709_c0_g4_i1.p1  ORF type:complete len:186 (-),score=43.33 TRINITY_DN5709_c0_g4_i1:16-573(-)
MVGMAEMDPTEMNITPDIVEGVEGGGGGKNVMKQVEVLVEPCMICGEMNVLIELVDCGHKVVCDVCAVALLEFEQGCPVDGCDAPVVTAPTKKAAKGVRSLSFRAFADDVEWTPSETKRGSRTPSTDTVKSAKTPKEHEMDSDELLASRKRKDMLEDQAGKMRWRFTGEEVKFMSLMMLVSIGVG